MRGLSTLLLTVFAATFLAANAKAQSLLFTTLSGNTVAGSADGTTASANFNLPTAVAVDSAGNVYIADTQNSTIRRIGTNQIVTTVAGLAGSVGAVDGTTNISRFYAPQGLAVDAGGNLYVADTANGTIRKIGTNGIVSTLAGSAGTLNSFDGIGTNANFFHPEGIAFDGAGNLYIADTWNHTIRKITAAGSVTTLAGLAGYVGSSDGTNSKARFNRPAGIAVDGATNVFVTDSMNHTIRKISPGGAVTTIAGLPGCWGRADGTNSTARFFQPQGVAVDGAGNVFVSDSGNQTIRKLSLSGTNWIVTTVAGFSGTAGHLNGTGDKARFSFPGGLAANGAGYLYLADAGNNSIRRESFELTTFGVLGDGRLHFTLNGKPNLQYEIGSSTNLSAWSVVTNLSGADGVLNFTEASSNSKRFYRARLLP